MLAIRSKQFNRIASDLRRETSMPVLKVAMNDDRTFPCFLLKQSVEQVNPTACGRTLADAAYESRPGHNSQDCKARDEIITC